MGLGLGVRRPVPLDLGPDDVEPAAAGKQIGRCHDLGLERLGPGGDRAERGLAGGELRPQLGGVLLVGEEGGLALLDLGERSGGPGQRGAGAGELTQPPGGPFEGVGGHPEGAVGRVGVDLGVGAVGEEVDGGKVLTQGTHGTGRGALGLGQTGAGVVEDGGLGHDRRGPASGGGPPAPAGDLALGGAEDLGPLPQRRPLVPLGGERGGGVGGAGGDGGLLGELGRAALGLGDAREQYAYAYAAIARIAPGTDRVDEIFSQSSAIKTAPAPSSSRRRGGRNMSGSAPHSLRKVSTSARNNADQTTRWHSTVSGETWAKARKYSGKTPHNV